MDRTWRTEKFEELPKEKQEEIAERVAKGQREASERQLRLKDRKEYLKIGRKHLIDNHVVVLRMKIHDYQITVGMQLNVMKANFVVAYAICSPNDNFSSKVGNGIVGQRLLSQPAGPFWYDEGISISHADVRLAVLQTMLKNPKTPSRLIKKILV